MNPATESPPGLKITGETSRPAALFLHGFMGSKSDWTEVMDELDPEFRCVAVDLPGHGSSLGLPDAAYTTDGAAKRVLRVLDGLEIPRVALVGYSMGGRLGLYLALRHPDRFSGLFLESSSPGLESAEERDRRRAADEEMAARLESGDFESFLRGWYRQSLFAPLARNAALLERTIGTRRNNDPAELARSLRGMGTGSQSSLWGELSNLRVPTLAVAGELDAKFVGISRRMEGLSPRIRSAMVPDAGHNVRAEAPERYLALLRGFLDAR